MSSRPWYRAIRGQNNLNDKIPLCSFDLRFVQHVTNRWVNLSSWSVCVDPWEWGRVGRPAFIHSVWTAAVCRRGRQVNWSLCSSSRNSWEHHHDKGYWLLYKLSNAVPSKSSLVSVDYKELWSVVLWSSASHKSCFKYIYWNEFEASELIQQKKYYRIFG